jgi:hypothetical protein
MITTACPCPAESLPSHVAAPVRSPRTSLILAEAARQRRRQCRQRRQRHQGRVRRAGWFVLFDCRPFDSICTRATPGVVFPGTMPLVYTLPLS